MARSGWVTPEGPERLTDHISLGVLTRVFPADVVDAVIGRTGALERRNRLLPSRLMVYYVMALALFSNGSYEEVMRSLLAGMEWLSGRFREWVMPTKAAIYKARTRLGSAVMVELFAEVAKPFAAPDGPGFYKEWRLVSVDGTTLDLADTPANERAYGRPGTTTDFKSAFPQARVLGLVECGTHAVFSAVASRYDTSEHDLYPALLADLAQDMLAMADRGFFSYTAWKDSAATGAALLWRMRANSALPSLEGTATAHTSQRFIRPARTGPRTPTASRSASSNTKSPPRARPPWRVWKTRPLPGRNRVSSGRSPRSCTRPPHRPKT